MYHVEPRIVPKSPPLPLFSELVTLIPLPKDFRIVVAPPLPPVDDDALLMVPAQMAPAPALSDYAYHHHHHHHQQQYQQAPHTHHNYVVNTYNPYLAPPPALPTTLPTALPTAIMAPSAAPSAPSAVASSATSAVSVPRVSAPSALAPVLAPLPLYHHHHNPTTTYPLTPTTELPPEYPKRSPPPPAKRRYMCKVCRRLFTTLGHLARHNRIHTGERNHTCPWPTCGAKFARHDNCMQHYRIHTNGKTKRLGPFKARAKLVH